MRRFIEKLKQNVNHIEIIDGVTVEHVPVLEREFSYEGGGIRTEKLVFSYNGKKFCENAPSMEEAKRRIEKLKEKGIAAEIGPRAPWLINGKAVENTDTNMVGIYYSNEKSNSNKQEEQEQQQ